MIDRQHDRIMIECDSCEEVFEGEAGEEFGIGLECCQTRRLVDTQDRRGVATRLSAVRGAIMIEPTENDIGRAMLMATKKSQPPANRQGGPVNFWRHERGGVYSHSVHQSSQYTGSPNSIDLRRRVSNSSRRLSRNPNR
jgi:hypothetical protein